METKKIVDPWFGDRPEPKPLIRRRTREPGPPLTPAVRAKKEFQRQAQREQEQISISGLVLDRWTKGQIVMATWPNDGEKHPGRVDAVIPPGNRYSSFQAPVPYQPVFDTDSQRCAVRHAVDARVVEKELIGAMGD
jgi:hypothetical protein